MTLTDFVLARITEDETVAKAALETWESDQAIADFEQNAEDASQAHIARFEPARILRQCEENRVLLAWADNEEAASLRPDNHPPYAGESAAGRMMTTSQATSAYIAWRLRSVVASIYADHPDFSPEWR